MPTNVLSRNTWGRNGPLTALLLVVSLFVGFVLVFVEFGGEVVFLAPAFGAEGGLGAPGIFCSPLFFLAPFFGFRLGGLGSVAHVRPQHGV